MLSSSIPQWLVLALVLPLLVTSNRPSASYTRSFELALKEKQTNLINKFKGHTHLHLSIKNGNVTSMFDSSRKVRYVNPYTQKAEPFDPLAQTLIFMKERWMVNYKTNQPHKSHPETLRMMLSLLSNELVDPRNKLFTSHESNRLYSGMTESTQVLQIDRFPHQKSHIAFIPPMTYPKCEDGSRCDLYFKMVGRVIGVAILNKQFMDITFSSSFYKFILGNKIELNDIQEIDPVLYNDLNQLLNSADMSSNAPTATYPYYDGTKAEARELVSGGSKLRITQGDKEWYVRMRVETYFDNHMAPAMTALRAGLFEMIPQDQVRKFNEDELRILISGNTHIDVDEWKEQATTNAMLHVFNARTKKWFWQIVRDWSSDMRSRLLLFVTGTSRLPVDGFKARWSSIPSLAWLSLPIDGYNMHWSPLPYYSWFTLVFHPETICLQISTLNGCMWLPRFRSFVEMKQSLEKSVLAEGGVSVWYQSNAEYPEFRMNGYRLAFRH